MVYGHLFSSFDARLRASFLYPGRCSPRQSAPVAGKNLAYFAVNFFELNCRPNLTSIFCCRTLGRRFEKVVCPIFRLRHHHASFLPFVRADPETPLSALVHSPAT